MTDSYVVEVLKNIKDMSTGLDANPMIVNTRNTVLTNIKKFQIIPSEQAKLYANFEIQFSVAVVTKLIDSVIESSLKEKQIDLLKQQILSETKNTDKIAAEIALINSQKAMVDQQKLTEVEQTIKTTKEGELLVSNKALVNAQTLTQEKQKLDVMAGINIKNEQALSTRESARFEEARRHVLIESTKQNAQIQKSKEENATLNSLALDDAFVITESHLLRIQTALNNITTTDVSYTSNLTTPAVGSTSAGL